MRFPISILLSFTCSVASAWQLPDENPEEPPTSHVRIWNGAPILFPAGHKPVPFHPVMNDLSLTPLQSTVKSAAGLADAGMFEPAPGPCGGGVRSIARDSSGWLFVATDGGVYRSSDNGAHWETHPFPGQVFNFVEPVTVLAPNVVVAETDYSNFVSTDRGESWNILYDDVQGFAVDTNGVIYAGSNTSGVRRSSNAGRSWSPFALPGKLIWKVVLCGGGRFVCTSDSGQYFSSDRGISWTFRPHTVASAWNLASDRRGHLFGSRFDTVLRSDDFGSTWRRLATPAVMYDNSIYRIYVEPDGHIFIPAYNGVLMSPDAGENWNLIPHRFSSSLTVGRDTAGNILCGSFEGIYRLDQASGVWQETNTGINARFIRAIQVASPGSMIAYCEEYIFRTTDNGVSWSKMSLDSGVYGSPLMFRASSGSIFMGANFGSLSAYGLLRSRDAGGTWLKISIPSNDRSVCAITEGDSSALCVGTSSGAIYRSPHDGDSWTKSVSTWGESAITSMASDRHGNYYASIDTSMLVSRDGVTWKKVPLSRRASSIESMSVDSRGVVFHGSFLNGVFQSTDHGATWKPNNDGFYGQPVLCMKADDSGNVFLGTGIGMYRLADSVDSWQLLNFGSPGKIVTALDISPSGLLFAGTQSYGLWRTINPVTRRIPGSEPPPPPQEEPLEFSLLQNYPNPFNPTTTIRYSLPQRSHVILSVYNTLGQEVATLVNGTIDAGYHDVQFNASKLASGMYFYRLQAGSYTETRKLCVMK